MSFYSRGRRSNRKSHDGESNGHARGRTKALWFALSTALLLMGVVLAACSNGSTANTVNNTTSGTPVVPPVALNQVKWCGSASETFRDQASSNPAGGTTSASSTQLGPADGKARDVKDWATFKSNLGFTLYLPKTLPAGSCLLSVSGSLRDEVFGSNFTITYILPDQSPLSFSQAPAHSMNLTFQCNVSQESSATPTASATAGTSAATGATPTQAAANSTQKDQNPIQLCNGLRDKTNIVFSSRGTTDSLKQFFQNLQADVDWQPAS